MPMPSPRRSMEAALPVIFFDGEQKVSIGDVVVFPALNIKGLQTILAERIGLSPYKFSVFLADRSSPGAKIPITGKTNFSEISRDREMSWAFLVVLKRSRRERRRECDNGTRMTHQLSPSPGNLMLLRRDGTNVAIDGNEFPGLDLGKSGYERRVRELRIEKERHLMNMGLELGLDPDMGMDRRVAHMEVAICEDCSRGENDDEFHWCVHDAVTYGFKSPAGPIARPGTNPSRVHYPC